jgi:hypothetical protein
MKKTKGTKQKGVPTAQGPLDVEPCGMGTPLSGSVGRTRRWMPPARRPLQVYAGFFSKLRASSSWRWVAIKSIASEAFTVSKGRRIP